MVGILPRMYQTSRNLRLPKTLPPSNMEPQNGALEDVFSFSNGWFSGSMLNFRGVLAIEDGFRLDINHTVYIKAVMIRPPTS